MQPSVLIENKIPTSSNFAMAEQDTTMMLFNHIHTLFYVE